MLTKLSISWDTCCRFYLIFLALACVTKLMVRLIWLTWPALQMFPHFSTQIAFKNPSLGEESISPVGGGLSSLVNSLVVVLILVAGAVAAAANLYGHLINMPIIMPFTLHKLTNLIIYYFHKETEAQMS